MERLYLWLSENAAETVASIVAVAGVCFLVSFSASVHDEAIRRAGKTYFLVLSCIFTAAIIGVCAAGRGTGEFTEAGTVLTPAVCAALFFAEYAVLTTQKFMPSVQDESDLCETAITDRRVAVIDEVPVRESRAVVMDCAGMSETLSEKYLKDCILQLKRAELSDSDRAALCEIEGKISLPIIGTGEERRRLSVLCGRIVTLMAEYL